VTEQPVINWFAPLFPGAFGEALSRLVGDPRIPSPFADYSPRERLAEDHRRYWSGPTIPERKICRAFAVTPQQIGVAPRSVFDGRYRTRQRNRRRRRR
jgi:hypothetical protein